MKILLTGASGFIGRNLTRMLLDNNHSVISVGRRKIHIPGMEEVVAPLLDYDVLDGVLKEYRVDAIIHLAAAGVNPRDRNDIEVMRVNSLLPGIVVSLADKYDVKSVVIVGSSSEYKGLPDNTKLTESSALESEKLYGATKAAGTLLAMSQSAIHSVPVAVVRLFNVYGPGEAKHRLLPTLLEKLSSKNEVRLSLGTQVRDFVYIDDVCSGLISIMSGLLDSSLNSGVYNLATGVGSTVADFARTVAELLGEDRGLLNFGALPFRPDDEPYIVGENSGLIKTLGWCPKYTMEDGIAKTIEINNRVHIK